MLLLVVLCPLVLVSSVRKQTIRKTGTTMNNLYHVLGSGRWRNPTTLTNNGMFICAATLLLLVTGRRMQAGRFPSLQETALSRRYSPWSTWLPFKLWMRLAVLVALVLPATAVAVWRRWSHVRQVFLSYMGVLIIQVATESVFIRRGLPTMNLVVGFVYTTYRVWQLWQSDRLIDAQEQPTGTKRGIIRAILLAGVTFWSLNWLILGINLVTRTLNPTK